MPRASRPTLADVARAAGVSLKQASRALNGEYGVSPATAAKVREAAKVVGFRPNTLARSLASGKPSAAIGLIVANLADPFFAAAAGAVERVAAERGLQILTGSHHDDPDLQRRIAHLFIERRVDALIIAPAPGNASYLQIDIDHGLSIVALDRPAEGIGVDAVVVNNREAAADAVGLLAKQGHSRISFVGRHRGIWTVDQRVAGYLDGLRSAGLAVDQGLVAIHPDDGEDLTRHVAAMLALDEPPTAFLAAGVGAARRAMRAALRARVSLTYAVFDDVSDPDLLAFPPIVIESDPVRLGGTAARMAIERIEGLAKPPRYIELPCHFTDARVVTA